jgi:hypothetical protein
MRGRLLHIDWNPEDTPEALHEAYRTATAPLVKPRLHALWLLRTGKRMAEVAPLLGFVYRTVQRWLAHYRHRAGLRSSGCRHAGTLMNSRTMLGRIGITGPPLDAQRSAGKASCHAPSIRQNSNEFPHSYLRLWDKLSAALCVHTVCSRAMEAPWKVGCTQHSRQKSSVFPIAGWAWRSPPDPHRIRAADAP